MGDAPAGPGPSDRVFAPEALAAGDAAMPLYRRLNAHLADAIDRGRLKPAQALPGERDIARDMAVSRVTVRKALSGLVEAGLLEQRQGSGTYVARRPPRVEQALSRLTSFTDDMRSRGLSTTSRWLLRELSPPTAREALHLALSPTDRVCHLRRLRVADGTPMAVEHAAVPHAILADPAAVEGSLYAVLEGLGLKPVRALQRLAAANLGDEVAGLLGVAAGSAALSIERVAYAANGRAVEFTHSFFRGDTYDFVAELTLG
ncbi:GntR family transcriptional regulator [Lichenibacterium minor]|uniref:GntR family transcriptional regulator n=1 Tax=Lichenibacterium minor TaxID=2316528 RepID=A0A4Q2U7Z4_9HYPH|nr:GntR family transcriptional regulator [Lichenibacterium minor]RYC32532.1 GntR family transcriptional regulator [Lichenibacterium minor]